MSSIMHDTSLLSNASAVIGGEATGSTTARKRRKRAPASGAADDCFACRKRNIKCDRRRPYCSQCLDQGKDCSGYKTQLTWGMGVASRGKLRGLSLPVIEAPPASAPAPVPSASRPRARQSSFSTAESLEGSRASSECSVESTMARQAQAEAPASSLSGFDLGPMDSTPSSALKPLPASAQYQYQSGQQSLEMLRSQGRTLYAHRRPLNSLLRYTSPPVSPYLDYGRQSYSAPVRGVSSYDGTSSVEASYTPRPAMVGQSLSVYDNPPARPNIPVRTPTGENGQMEQMALQDQSYATPSLRSSLSSTASSKASNQDYSEFYQLPYSPMVPCDVSNNVFFDEDMAGTTPSRADDVGLGLNLGCGSFARLAAPAYATESSMTTPNTTHRMPHRQARQMQNPRFLWDM